MLPVAAGKVNELAHVCFGQKQMDAGEKLGHVVEEQPSKQQR